MNETTRLDRAIAMLKASDQVALDADRWQAISMELNGLELTGAPDEVRQAIESFGVSCNAIMEPYQASTADSYDDWDQADTAKLVELSRQLAELIRKAESDRILARLRRHDGVLPEAEIIEARRHRDWFTPFLLRECQLAIDAVKWTDAEQVEAEDQHNSIPFFSLFLFSEWNAIESVPVVLRALKLSGERPFDLFADGIHIQVPRYLAQFLSEDLDCIDELIRNSSGNPYVRWAAASSYKYLVRDRTVSIDDAVSRLERLFHETKVVGEDGRPGLGHCYEVSTGIVEVIASIGGRAGIPDHDRDWDFIDESIIDRDELAEMSDDDDVSELSNELQHLPTTCLKDCLEELCRWAAFTPTRKPSRPQRTPQPRHRRDPFTDQAASQSVPPPKAIVAKKKARVPRNARCPCGSGKKYKQCCLRRGKLNES